MLDIASVERTKYEQMWAVDDYSANSPGELFLPIFLDMAKPLGLVLDAGCGAGRGALALSNHGLRVVCCDIVDVRSEEAKQFPFRQCCLWDPLPAGPVDWTYCTDVLEHVPTPLTMLVVTRLLEVSKQGVFMTVSFVPDTNGVWIGETLHETVQPFVWWRDFLGTVGKLQEARDFLVGGAFLLKAK